MPLPKEWRKKGELTVRDLISRLIEEGFLDGQTLNTSHKRTIWIWESEGIIPKPRYKKLPNGWDARVYTKKEIGQIVRKLNSYPIKKVLAC